MYALDKKEETESINSILCYLDHVPIMWGCLVVII